METLLSTNAVMQINNEAFASWSQKKIAKQIIHDEKHFVFGSDAHNITDRKPNWEYLKKKVKPEILAKSNEVLDCYTL